MTTSVRREVVLPVTPEELWPALTEAERLSEWFAPDVDIDARPGGAAVFRWEDGARRAVIEEVEAPRRLSFRWSDADADADGHGGEVERSRVEFTLDEVAEGTRLRVVETAAAESLPAVVAVLGGGSGWPRMLARLARVRAAAAA